MKKISLIVFTFLLGQVAFAQVSSIKKLFAQKDVAQIAARVEFIELKGSEDLISCKNFRLRLKEAGFKNEETAIAVTAAEFRYVLDHTKSYMGFYDYHALTKLKFTWQLPQELWHVNFLAILETETLKVFTNTEEFITFKVSEFTRDQENLSFNIELPLVDLCSENGVRFSLFKDCESTDLAELQCEQAKKYNFYTGALENFHPTKIRLDKTRLSELGLGGEND